MSEDLTLTIVADLNESFAQIEALNLMVDEATRKAALARQKIMHEVHMASAAIHGVTSLFRNIVHAFGVVLTPAQEAILNLIMTAATSMVAIAAAFTSTGIGIIAGAMFAAAALGLSIGATAAAIQGIKDASGKIADIDAILGSLESLSMVGRHY